MQDLAGSWKTALKLAACGSHVGTACSNSKNKETIQPDFKV